MRRLQWFLWAAALVFLLAQRSANGGWLDRRFNFPGANGWINELLEFRGNLYAVGPFTQISGVDAPGFAVWRHGAWTGITPPFNASVNQAVATDFEIIFSLVRVNSNSPAGMLRYNGSRWRLISPPETYTDVLRVFNPEQNEGTLYAELLSQDHTHALAKWTGRWTIIQIDNFMSDSEFWDFFTLRGDQFAVGWFNSPGGGNFAFGSLNGSELSRIWKWNWTYDAASDGRNLYVAGYMNIRLRKGTVSRNGFSRWDGNGWTDLAPDARSGLVVTSLTENQGAILASEVVGEDPAFPYPFFPVSEQYVVEYRNGARKVLARGDADMQTIRRIGKDIFATGDFKSVRGEVTGNVAHWDGSRWSRMGSSNFYGLSGDVTGLCVAGSNLFAVGRFDQAGAIPARHLARWNGKQWNSVPGISGEVRQMSAQGSTLFAIGEFKAGRATNIAKWKGAWASVGGGLTGFLIGITANETGVYVLRSTNSVSITISHWNGVLWRDAAGGTLPEGGSIFALAELKGRFYVGGQLANIDGVAVNNIAEWRDGAWTSMNGGLFGEPEWEPHTGYFSGVNSLVVFGTNLVAGGAFLRAGDLGVSNIAQWDGSNWSSLGDGIPGVAFSSTFGGWYYPVSCLAASGTNLFSGGGSGGSPPLYRWNGLSWSRFLEVGWTSNHPPDPWDNRGVYVSSLAIRGEELYIGGDFAAIGATESHGLALWHFNSAPAFQAKLSETQLILTWDGNYPNAKLEVNSSMQTENWQPLKGAGRVHSHDGKTHAILSRPDGTRFYRLIP